MSRNRDAIVHEVAYPHPIERVWAALTEREALAAWLMPNDFAPRLGHRFTLTVLPSSGWSGTIACEVVALEPPHRLAIPGTAITRTRRRRSSPSRWRPRPMGRAFTSNTAGSRRVARRA